MDAYAFFEVTREEGYARLWRGTNASLALTVPCVGIYLPCYDILRNSMDDSTIKSTSNLSPPVPLVAGSLPRSFACITCYPVEPAKTNMQAFKKPQSGVEPPGIWTTLQDVIDPVGSQNESFVAMNIGDFDEQMCAGISSISEVYEKPYLEVQNLRTLWSGLGAQLAREVPFYAICWATLEPMRRRIVGVIGDEASIGSVVGANFLAGLFAGSVAAAATYPLDVAKMRRQLQEKDGSRASRMTTKQTLVEMWRSGGVQGMYKGVGGRVGRAGLSVGIVVSFYQTTKYVFYHGRRSTEYK